MAENSKKRPGGRTCCVVGCSHNYKVHGKDVRFFQFPTRDLEQREKWISAVKRVDSDGKPWVPSNNATICSAHFHSGIYSRTRGHPDYVPTIFPTLHVKPKSEQDESRFQRQQRRYFMKTAAATTSSFDLEDECGNDLEERWKISDMFATQTEDETGDIEHCFSWRFDHIPSDNPGKSDASTMASLPKMCSRKSGWDYPLLNEFSTQTEPDVKLQKGFEISEFTDRQFKAFIGVARNVFNCVVWLLQPHLKSSVSLELWQMLALHLIKLKLNISFAALSAMFSISEKKASEIFNETLQAMVKIAPNGVVWLSKQQVKARMPASFRGLYPDCRVIIDCSEIAIERPKTLEQRVLTWSNYKGRHTVKFLVGCAPSGEITFISRTRGGRSTDAEITIDSGILNYVEVGDIVLADKGFPQIQADVNNAGGILVMPPFKIGQQQFSQQESNRAYECASVRVHVERCIARMKTFEILKFLSHSQMTSIDDILYVISFLVNFNKDLIKGQ